MRIPQRLDPAKILRATATAGIANMYVAGGAVVPIIMVDCSDRNDVNELIRVHEHLPAGDCVLQWSTVLGSNDQVLLNLKFERPIGLEFVIEFELPLHAGAIDNILQAGMFQLQNGVLGDTPSSTQGRPRINIELPATGFGPIWEKIFQKTMINTFRAEGLGRKEARAASILYITNWRRVMDFGST
ncbi:hypothetical protein [Rhodococcus sp. NPDC055024]